MRPPTAPKQRRWIWYVLLPILAVLLLWAGDTLYHAVRFYQDARQAQVLSANGLSRQTLAEGIPLLHDSYQEFSALEQNLHPLLPILDGLGKLPGLGKYAAQASPLLSYARNGLLALDLFTRGLSPILDQLSKSGTSPNIMQTVVAELALGQPKFEAASFALDEMAAARKSIQPDLLPQKARDAIQKVDDIYSLARGGLTLISSLPQLAGLDQEQTYLLAAQNNDELRPTGGFISALGLIKVKSGQITAFSMQDSFAVDDFSKNYPYPPEPLQRFMLSGYWVPRDANWFADFPSSARKLQELYELSTGQKTAGVIAFDQSAVADLLQELGPQQIEGMSEPLTGENAIEWMRQAWSPQPGQGVDLAWWAQRKNFIAQIGKTILTQMNSLKDEQKAASLIAAGYRMLREGHLLIFMNQAAAEDGLAQAGLDGSIQKPPGSDFLMLVDANIGFNKVDAMIRRSVDYQIDLSNPAKPTAQFKASYTNLAQRTVACKQEAAYGENYADLEQRCYWDYWRVITNPGSQLIKQNTPAIPADWLLNRESWDGRVSTQTNEAGLTEFAGLIVLATGAKGGFELDWTLPAGTLQHLPSGWDYRLRIQKQAGLTALPVTVSVLPPDGCTAMPAPDWTLKDNQIVWAQKIAESVILNLKFACR